MNNTLLGIYKRLYDRFGPQDWWPGDTEFEVIVGAILTQNTSWSNVEKAIKNLKKHRLLSRKKLPLAGAPRIAKLIKPSGYYNIKAKRLSNFLDLLNSGFGGSLKKMLNTRGETLRKALLGVNGIGPETADSILLYAANKPFFVIDAYTKRVFSRHGLAPENTKYEGWQRFFMSNLPNNSRLYNEYHALIVRLAKEYCKKKPECRSCPLKGIQ